MSTKAKESKKQPELLIIDWDMYDHPDPEERRAYRLWLVLYHEASWGRSVEVGDLCRRLECSRPQLNTALARLENHYGVSTIQLPPPDSWWLHGPN
jgi:hypothetical protein